MFFSVKSAVKIGSRTYIPCICYLAKEDLVPVIEKLVAEGKACTYPERVFFQNGRVLEKKSAVKDTLTAKTKKAKKETKEEDIPSPEEIADNLGSEGF